MISFFMVGVFLVWWMASGGATRLGLPPPVALDSSRASAYAISRASTGTRFLTMFFAGLR